MTDARDVVVGILRSIAPEVKEIAEDADLREDLELDSMDFLRFVVGLHDAFRIDIPERDYSKLATLSGVVSYLRAAKAIA